MGQIGNENQTDYFDMPLILTVNVIGEINVPVVISSNGNQSCKVMLKKIEDGRKLTPHVSFGRKAILKGMNSPCGMIARAREKAWTNKAFMVDPSFV